MDLGASRHVCNDKHLFKTLTKVVDREALYIENNSSIKVLCKGQIELIFTSGNILILRHVYSSPDKNRNLILRPSLNWLGYKLIFESDQYIISKNSVYVSRCYLLCNILMLCLKQSYLNLVTNVST